MKLVVMSPLELGEKLTDLEIKDDWTVGPHAWAWLEKSVLPWLLGHLSNI